MATETLKSKTAKGVFWSSASNLLSQVVNMLFGLVLARILAPEDYGIVGLLTVFTGLATALQECGLSSASSRPWLGRLRPVHGRHPPISTSRNGQPVP